MIRLLAFTALIGASSPALADHQPNGWSEYRARPSLDRASHRGRTYVYFGHDAWAPRVFSRDDGYFQGRGGGVAVANGKALYDYDREYPYDFPAGWGAGESELYDADRPSTKDTACSFAPVRDRRTGAQTEVRICR